MNIPEHIKAFISYNHESEAHQQFVLNFAKKLRADGIDCIIDLYETAPPQGWALWMEEQIEEADVVLLVCTETYARRFRRREVVEIGEGKGVGYESALITNMLYLKYARTSEFIPIIPPEGDINHIPHILKSHTFYTLSNDLDNDTEYEKLYGFLTQQLEDRIPPLGEIREIKYMLPREVNRAYNQETASSLSESQENQANPFIVGRPVHGSRFFGRKDIIHAILSLYKHFPEMPIQSAAIWGKNHIGKTSLLMQFKDIAVDKTLQKHNNVDWLSQTQYKYTWIFIDLRDVRFWRQFKLLEYIISQMHFYQEVGYEISETTPLADFYEIVQENLKNPTIILLDEIGFALRNNPEDFNANFWDTLRALTISLEPQCLGFVVSSNQHPAKLVQQLDNTDSYSDFFNIFAYSFKVQPFTEEEAKQIIRSSPYTFQVEDIEFIIRESGREPHLIQLLCRYCYQAYEINTPNWQENAKEAVAALRETDNHVFN